MVPPTASRLRKWKNIWIDPHYQARFIVWITLPTFTIALSSAFGIRRALENLIAELARNGLLDARAHAILLEYLSPLFSRALLLTVFAAVLAAGLGLVLSHRTAGALYHFKRVFRDVQAGKRDARIHLRKHDDFQEVADEANAALDALTGVPTAHEPLSED